MGRPGVVVRDRVAELRHDGLGIPQIRAVDVVPFEVFTKASGRLLLCGLYAGAVIGTRPNS